MAGSRRAALVVSVLASLWCVRAEARPRTYAVVIDTDPRGATVFLDDENGEELGETPYRGRLEAGTYAIYLRREGHEPMFETIQVKKKRRGRQSFEFELARILYGSVEIVSAADAPRVDGARVLLDGDEMGNAPDIIGKVAVGPHQVEIIKDGYEVFEAWIEVAEGETTEIEVELEPDGSGVAEAGGDEDDVDLDDEERDADVDDALDPDEEGAVAATRRTPLVVVAIGPEIGQRQFEYDEPLTNNLRPYKAAGVPMLHVRGELYPLARAGIPYLAGLGVTGSYARAATLQSATAAEETLETRWSDYYVGARLRLPVGAGHIGVDGGIGAETFEFDPIADPELFSQVPDVSYGFTRFGADVGAVVAEHWSLSAAFDYRIVGELGTLQTRFDSTQVGALGGSLGIAYLLDDTWDVHLRGRYGRYKLTFTYQDDAEYQAIGAVDQFFGATLGIGYRL